VLDQILERYRVVQHGVSMYFGSAEKLNRDHLRRLKALVKRTRTPWLTDHLCWGSVDGTYSHDLLPMPYTDEALRHMVARVSEVQDLLGRQILIENVSSYLSFQHSTLTEWEFLSAVTEEADCGILLDLNNIYVSAFNHGFDPELYLRSVPVERVAQYHLAGHRNCGTYLLDTHDRSVLPAVWSLYELAARRFGKTSTLIEWDDQIPEFSVLHDTAEKARTLYDRSKNSVQQENRGATPTR